MNTNRKAALLGLLSFGGALLLAGCDRHPVEQSSTTLPERADKTEAGIADTQSQTTGGARPTGNPGSTPAYVGDALDNPVRGTSAGASPSATPSSAPSGKARP